MQEEKLINVWRKSRPTVRRHYWVRTSMQLRKTRKTNCLRKARKAVSLPESWTNWRKKEFVFHSKARENQQIMNYSSLCYHFSNGEYFISNDENCIVHFRVKCGKFTVSIHHIKDYSVSWIKKLFIKLELKNW